MKLGTLEITQVNEKLELLAEPVKNFILSTPVNKEIGVTKIDPNLSDTTAFCEYYKVDMNQSVNCVVLEAKRADRTWYVACLILGSTRADVNGLVRRTLDARRVSFAPMELAVEKTGMEYGAITPIGLPNDWPILIDKVVADSEYVIIGSGIRGSKIAVSGLFLASLPNATVIEGLGQKK